MKDQHGQGGKGGHKDICYLHIMGAGHEQHNSLSETSNDTCAAHRFAPGLR